jgi:hypothetical protein
VGRVLSFHSMFLGAKAFSQSLDAWGVASVDELTGRHAASGC